jgi:UDP-glucose 4-epimerase
MKRVWVTGTAGFLGRGVARRFLSGGWTVVGIGNPPRDASDDPAPVSPIEGRPAFVAGPITPASLERALELGGPPDVVVHAAGSGAVAPSFADPLKDFDRAVTSTALVLDCLRRHAPAARLVLPSSAAVYGVRPPGPISEDTQPAPVSPYGGHKLAAEILCRQAQTSFGQPVAILRLFSLYGPGLRKQLLWDLSMRLAARPAMLTMDGTGEETRDLLYIDDAVELAWQAGQGPQEYGLVNGGTGQASTVRQVAEGLIARISPQTQLAFTGAVRLGDPRYLCADATRLNALGYSPRLSLRQGLDSYVAWLGDIGMLP